VSFVVTETLFFETMSPLNLAACLPSETPTLYSLLDDTALLISVDTDFLVSILMVRDHSFCVGLQLIAENILSSILAGSDCTDDSSKARLPPTICTLLTPRNCRTGLLQVARVILRTRS
jgi:hypothetical protein